MTWVKRNAAGAVTATGVPAELVGLTDFQLLNLGYSNVDITVVTTVDGVRSVVTRNPQQEIVSSRAATDAECVAYDTLYPRSAAAQFAATVVNAIPTDGTADQKLAAIETVLGQIAANG